MKNEAIDPESAREQGWWTRDHALVLVLAATTVLLLYLCWQIVQPFMGPLAWAVALATVAQPLYKWVCGRIENNSAAAAVSVVLIAIVIVAPAIFVGHQIVREATSGVQKAEATFREGKWREQIGQMPWVGKALSVAQQNGEMDKQLQGMTADVGKRISKVVTGSAWAVVELILTLFVLFFLFRDRRKSLKSLRSLVPLSEKETDGVFARVSDTIHATIYGTLVVAAVQGTLGGLMFWWLGLPGPILWGAVMALLAVVPVLGAFVVWVPAALFLAATGAWGKALILTGWGVIVIGLIDNLLYPILVGKRLRMHTVPVFFSIVGGLMLFGAAGLVLGPVVLALTDAIIEIWRRRTAHGQPAEVGAAIGDLPKNEKPA